MTVEVSTRPGRLRAQFPYLLLDISDPGRQGSAVQPGPGRCRLPPEVRDLRLAFRDITVQRGPVQHRLGNHSLLQALEQRAVTRNFALGLRVIKLGPGLDHVRHGLVRSCVVLHRHGAVLVTLGVLMDILNGRGVPGRRVRTRCPGNVLGLLRVSQARVRLALLVEPLEVLLVRGVALPDRPVVQVPLLHLLLAERVVLLRRDEPALLLAVQQGPGRGLPLESRDVLRLGISPAMTDYLVIAVACLNGVLHCLGTSLNGFRIRRIGR